MPVSLFLALLHSVLEPLLVFVASLELDLADVLAMQSSVNNF